MTQAEQYLLVGLTAPLLGVAMDYALWRWHWLRQFRWNRWRGFAREWLGSALSLVLAYGVISLFHHPLAWAFYGALANAAAAWALGWWQRKGKRAAALLSERGRILRETLMRRMRESARPSPVLRPSLRGASS